MVDVLCMRRRIAGSGFSPGLRRDGNSKVFRMPLNALHSKVIHGSALCCGADPCLRVRVQANAALHIRLSDVTGADGGSSVCCCCRSTLVLSSSLCWTGVRNVIQEQEDAMAQKLAGEEKVRQKKK